MDMNSAVINQFNDLIRIAVENGVEDASINNQTYSDGTSRIELELTYKTDKPMPCFSDKAAEK